MAIDDVIAKIKETAESKRLEIIKEAESEKTAIMAEWQNKADEFYSEEKRKIDLEVGNEKRSLILAKKLELRKKLLSAKQQLIDLAFSEAFEKVKTMPEKEYNTLCERLLEETSEGGEEVISNKKDNALMAKLAKKAGLKMAKETRECAGGFILRKGRVETNVSMETIFSAKRSELEQEVGKLLNVF